MKVTRALMILAVCTLLVTGLSCGGGSDTYQLTTVIEGEGSVSPSSGDFSSGSMVTLTASPASDWAFTHWGGNANGSENIVNVTMDSDKTVYAYFTNNSVSMSTPTPSPISTSIPPTPAASPSLSDGSIDIASTPAGAAIYIDDVNTGSVTPLTINVAEGNHSIKLTLYHYIDKIGTVTISAGTTIAINWPMTPAPDLTLTIQPDEDDSKDTYVYQMAPDSNFDSDDTLAVDQSEYYLQCRSYIQFDMSSLPSSAVITGVRLGLYYCNHNAPSSTSASIGTYKVIGNWDASTITWNNQPAHSTSAESTSTVPANPTYDFIYWDITDLAEGWFKGYVTNNGLVLISTDESALGGTRHFRASVVQTATQRPKLEITYFNPSPSILPINTSIFH